jgi:hypothetical protein
MMSWSEARHYQRHVLGQARGDELLDEIDPHAARQEDVERVGLRRAHLGELGGVVELAELGVHLGHHAALVEALEAGQGILAGLVVGRDQVGVLVAFVRGVLARGLVVGVVRPGGDEEIRVAFLAGERRRRGVRADVDSLGVEGHRHRGEHDVGEHDAGQEVDLVELHQLLRGLAADVGLELIIGDQHLGREAAQPAAVHLERELEAVADVDPERGARPGERADEPDANLVCGDGAAGERGGGKCGGNPGFHAVPLEMTRRF